MILVDLKWGIDLYLSYIWQQKYFFILWLPIEWLCKSMPLDITVFNGKNMILVDPKWGIDLCLRYIWPPKYYYLPWLPVYRYNILQVPISNDYKHPCTLKKYCLLQENMISVDLKRGI